MIHDALIIGGGPAGASAAWLLARAGWNIVVIEKASYPRRKVCGEFVSGTTLPLLRLLDMEPVFFEKAGPPVHEVAIYAGNKMLTAPIARPRDSGEWGRALEREHLDTLLLLGARHAGAEVLQPCVATALTRRDGFFCCRCGLPEKHADREVKARIVIAAQGSWGKARLPPLAATPPAQPTDLFAFKAHFGGSGLSPGRMPMIAFPGGYGGMVLTGQGRMSLSCCIRHDLLRRIRAHQNASAGEAVLAHILRHNLGAKRTLHDAIRVGTWLSSGPLRPGIRRLYRDGVFAVGNAAGEAHPIIAEGISMAMQGAWLLSRLLIENRAAILKGQADAVGADYARLWRRSFAFRIHSAALFARLAMQPAASTALLPVFQAVPALLTACTRYSGKANAFLDPVRQ